LPACIAIASVQKYFSDRAGMLVSRPDCMENPGLADCVAAGDLSDGSVNLDRMPAPPAGLALVGHVQAQTVHKCIVNGAAVYQAAACPAANEQKSLVIPPRRASRNCSTPRPTAASRACSRAPTCRGRPRRAATTPRARSSADVAVAGRRDAAPSTNCDQLNQHYHDAQYRRDESAPVGARHRREPLRPRHCCSARSTGKT
jgi:hypothetical protein